MRLYIDPGTGSMLFAILIGLIGAFRYLLKSWLVKLRFRMSGGKSTEAEQEKLPLVIFSDDKRYWQVFGPVCRELSARGVEVTYMTESADDPALTCGYEHLHGEFIGQGNKGFVKLNFLRATVLLSTTPGLDVYQWKRSKGVDCYIHMLHAPGEISGYRMFGTDYYDAIMISGDFQVEQIRALEKLRGLPQKEIVHVGIPYLDEMAKHLRENPPQPHEGRTVLLAPSWGSSAILSRYGGKMIDLLLKTGYHIIVRPHPQSFAIEKELMDDLMKKYPDSEQLEWNRDNDNFEVLKRSDIMISDFSGVIFDFTLVYDKPIIYADTDYKSDPYDTWWLGGRPWTFDVLPKLGMPLTKDNFEGIKQLIDSCLSEERFKEGRDEVRREVWEFPDEGAVRAADYLEEKYRLLTSAKKQVTGEHHVYNKNSL